MRMFSDLIDTVIDNPLTSLACVAATVGTGGLAVFAAPAIASTLGGLGLLGAASSGTAISTLSGAALAKASLAALGGGAIASGGGGIAAGTALVGNTAGAVAASVSGLVLSTKK